MKPSFLDKLIDRIDRVDPRSLQGVVLKLSREKGFLETLVNTIQEGIIVTDADGRINYLNNAAADLISLSADDAVGQPVARFLHDLDWNKIWSADVGEWRKVISQEIEIFIPRHRFLSFYIVPLVNQDNSMVTGMAVILRDITETRQRTETVIESEKVSALTLLAAGVAHEIGNPLNSLHIHLQILERDIKTLPPAQAKSLAHNVRVARDEIARLDRIINQFLRAIRPTKPDLRPASIHAVIEDALNVMKAEITDRDILVEREFCHNTPKLLLDAAQMKQAFYNIIKNALQAMRSGGILRIRTELTESHLVISFTDTGHGISPDQIGKIFEPYHTTKEQGTGLGLMIVQRIIREHGGVIEIESQSGRGATFRLRLPLREKRTRLLEAPKSTPPLPAP